MVKFISYSFLCSFINRIRIGGVGFVCVLVDGNRSLKFIFFFFLMENTLQMYSQGDPVSFCLFLYQFYDLPRLYHGYKIKHLHSQPANLCNLLANLKKEDIHLSWFFHIFVQFYQMVKFIHYFFFHSSQLPYIKSMFNSLTWYYLKHFIPRN
jgi:hypothetical protein